MKRVKGILRVFVWTREDEKGLVGFWLASRAGRSLRVVFGVLGGDLVSVDACLG